MKILHAGNMANLGYVITKQLRKDNLDVELLIEKNPPKTSDPLRFDPELKNVYPEWINFFDKSAFWWKIELIKKMRNKKYDLIHAYVEFPIFAYLSRRPFIANTQGSDFRELALTNSVRGILLRRAYKKAKAVLFFQPDHYHIFSRLKLNNGIFLPPLWDISFFQSKKITSEYDDKFIIFHPTSLNWRLKGNNILINGFEKFVKNNPNAVLIIVDRGIDSQKTKDLIKKLGIENYIKFIHGPLNSWDLLKYYNIADVIVDQFVYGVLGSIAWEVFSCAKPLIAFVNDKQYTEVYGQAPSLANASTAIGVSEQLENLKNSGLRKKIGLESREWITKYHSPSIFLKKIKKLYEMVLSDEPIEDIRHAVYGQIND